MDWMQQPPAGISVRGILRPIHDVDRSVFHMKTQDESNASTDESISSSAPDSENISGDASETKERTGSGISYYKLEMVNMKLVSSHGHQVTNLLFPLNKLRHMVILQLPSYIRGQGDIKRILELLVLSIQE